MTLERLKKDFGNEFVVFLMSCEKEGRSSEEKWECLYGGGDCPLKGL